MSRSTDDLDGIDLLAKIRECVRRGDRRISQSLMKITGYSSQVTSKYVSTRYNFTVNQYQQYFRLYYAARLMMCGKRMEDIANDIERNYVWLLRDFKRVYTVTPGKFRMLPFEKQRELLLINPIFFPEDING